MEGGCPGSSGLDRGGRAPLAASLDVRAAQDLALAVEVLRESGASHVFVREGRVVASGSGRGVVSLVRTVERCGPDRLAGSCLADKVVGRAALLVALACGVRAVHGEFMSEGAIATCQSRSVPFTYGVAIPRVLNQSGTDYCPFETLVAGVDDPAEGLRRIRERARALEAGGRPSAGAEGLDARGGGMSRLTVQAVARAGMWLAAAVLLPGLLHPLGLGPALLPMHLPVLLAAALGGPAVGGLVGAAAPLISHAATGMPPLIPPVAPLMAVELAAYGVAGGCLRPRAVGQGRASGPARTAWLTEYRWLVPTMLAGRVALGLAAQALGPSLGLAVPGWVYVYGAVVSGLPGITLQLALVPLLVSRLARLDRGRGGSSARRAC